MKNLSAFISTEYEVAFRHFKMLQKYYIFSWLETFRKAKAKNHILYYKL